MKHNNLKRTLIATALLTALSTSMNVSAEGGVGVIKGVVNSTSGAQLNGATVTLKHNDKGIERTVETDADGSYTLRNLLPGSYTLSIKKDGFEVIEESNFDVAPGRPINLESVLLASGEALERISVTGSMIRLVDTSSATGGVSMSREALERMPVDTGFESVALLMPGAALSGSPVNFKGASSIGGSSAAENGYYVNGINITQIRSGLGAMGFPWGVVDYIDIMSGGINAEYGNAIGGIANATTKSGGNDFEFAVQYRLDPMSFYSGQDSVANRNPEETSLLLNRQRSDSEFTETQVSLSGPLIEDTLFFYGLFSPRKDTDEFADATTFTNRVREEDRWMVRMDWVLNEEHTFDITAINNTREGRSNVNEYNEASDTIGEAKLPSYEESGGHIYGAHYAGILTDELSVDVVVAQTEEKEIAKPNSFDPSVRNITGIGAASLSNHTNASVTNGIFTRDQARVDFTYEWDAHTFKFGADYQSIDVDYSEDMNGIGSARGWWTVRKAVEGDRTGQSVDSIVVERRLRPSTTVSNVKSEAVYFQDLWQVTDDVSVNLGLRYSNASNTTTEVNGDRETVEGPEGEGFGKKYVDISGQLAPRVQANWDVYGDGSTKVFATFGRYFQPVSVNMNIKQGGSQFEGFDYYKTDQVDADGLPILLADGSPSIGERSGGYVRQKGLVDPALIASANLKSMYSDEITLGFEAEVFDTMKWGVRGVHRELKRAIEDTDFGPILKKKLVELGIEDNVGQGSYYVIHNPGEEVVFSYDFDQDGTVDNIVLAPEDHLLPKASRTYYALETSLQGNVRDDLNVYVSYTWSHSYGLTEGLVKTDNEQADPGWTTSYDYLDLMDNGYGNLPNDHRHALKFNAVYNITEDLTLGLVGRAYTGRPEIKLSRHPLNVDSCKEGNPWDACISQYYDLASFYDENKNPSPRGSLGNIDTLKNLDMSLTYKTEFHHGQLTLKATVYNLLNWDSAIDVQDEVTLDDGTKDLNWGATTRYQTPRYVSFVARYEF